MIVRGFNPELDELEQTMLTGYSGAGATSLAVAGNQQFAQNDRILIGQMGTENAEIVSINASVTLGNTLPISASVFPHNGNDPIFQLRYDKVKFYRSVTGINGAYLPLATVSLDVDNENLLTPYDDTTGTSSYYYKVSYYNSITSAESDMSDPVAGAGYPRNSVGFLTDEILSELKDKDERTVTRTDLTNWMNEVDDDLLTRARKPYLFLKRSQTVNSITNTYIPYPDDMWKFDRFEYTWTIGSQASTREFYPIDNEEFRLIDYNTNTLSTDNLQFISLDDINHVIKTYPKFLTTQTNAVTIYYYKYFTEINSPSDVFETPSPNIYKLYCLGKYFRSLAKGDTVYLTLSQAYFQDYNTQVAKLQRVNDKNVGTPMSFKMPTRRMQTRRFGR